MTYPEPAVADLVNEHFVPVQVNVKEDSAKSLIERYHQIWTPDLRVLGADGYEFYHWNGYLPPFEYAAQLLVAEGQTYLRLHEFGKAQELYEEILSRFPTSAFAPEAQYFLAVAKYETSHQGTDLLSGWHRVQTRYPESIWRVKQSFTESK
ncbi:MAG: hypothetical protein EPO21_19000 [Chloroflexota bacterium]|nr:MAG: hypothetical protein EPO21_19000 [Chloroflexota bacterium]